MKNIYFRSALLALLVGAAALSGCALDDEDGSGDDPFGNELAGEQIGIAGDTAPDPDALAFEIPAVITDWTPPNVPDPGGDIGPFQGAPDGTAVLMARKGFELSMDVWFDYDLWLEVEAVDVRFRLATETNITTADAPGGFTVDDKELLPDGVLWGALETLDPRLDTLADGIVERAQLAVETLL